MHLLQTVSSVIGIQSSPTRPGFFTEALPVPWLPWSKIFSIISNENKHVTGAGVLAMLTIEFRVS